MKKIISTLRFVISAFLLVGFLFVGATKVFAATPLTVTATGVDKVYDGTPYATVVLSSNKAPADNVNITYNANFSDKNIGVSKIVSVINISISGPDAANYTLSNTTATTTATITPFNIIVKARPNTKDYDGTTSSVTIPTPQLDNPPLPIGDTPNFTQVYADKYVGTGKNLVPSGMMIDGNGGNNYIYDFNTRPTGDITAVPLTVTALPYTRAFVAGDVGASITPTITGSLASGETPYFSETFDTPAIGTGKTLTPAGGIIDAGAGNTNSNYIITYVSDHTGVITPIPTRATVTCPASVVFNGALQTPCTARVTGDVSLPSHTLTVNYTNNMNVGIATATATYAGDATHSGSSDSKNFTITAGGVATFTLSYTANANGTISGVTSQTVNQGASGTPVTAVANSGFHFVNWSDASVANPRTDTNVVASITVSANFNADGGSGGGPGVTLNSIAITTPATKLTYTVGDTLDITGLVVTGTYSDGSTQFQTITPADISGFDSSVPVAGQVLTITSGGKTTTYTVNINAAAVVLPPGGGGGLVPSTPPSGGAPIIPPTGGTPTTPTTPTDGGQVLGAATGPTVIPGCDNRTTGFSTITGESCANNLVTGQVLGADTFIFTQYMKRGMKGSEIPQLQERLNTEGFNAGNVDGKFGPLTYTAVRAYQTAHTSLQVDGIVGPYTRGELNLNPLTFKFQKFMKKGSRITDVPLLQRRLRAETFYNADVGPVFNSDTETAVKDYQAAHPPLKVDGVVGTQTRAVLNK